MRYIIDKESRPVYLQLYKLIRDDIINGVFLYGGRLPSKRLLAEETGVSTVTVEHAYALLCDEGYALSREKSGFFVNFRRSDGFAVPSDGEGKSYGEFKASVQEFPSFSVSILSKTMRRVLSERGEDVLKKSPNKGLPELREAIKRYLARNRGITVDTGQIIIGSGAEYLYRLIIELLGRDKTYAIERPSYDKLEQIYRAAGVKYEQLELSYEGIDSSRLLQSSADVLHTTPYRSFPSGVTASATKRHEYIRWSDKGDRFIIESDYGSEFSVSSQPMESLFALSDNDNVVYLNTFSRTISPAMRIGYMVIPKRLTENFDSRLGFYSCTVSTFEQLVLSELINNSDFERHINRVRRNKRKELKLI